MNIDPLAMTQMVEREVRTLRRDGQPTRVTVARRAYATDVADLWDAVTNPERLPRWFLPVSGDLQVGGRYQLEGNASGTVEACDPPASFAVTWEFAQQVSWVAVTLTEESSDTRSGPTTILEVAHEAQIDEAFWDQFGPGAAGVGWDLGLMGLALHLDVDVPVNPEEAMAWPTTPDGTRFVTLAADGWAQAAIADGDDADNARAAAKRTVGFYTTVPEG